MASYDFYIDEALQFGWRTMIANLLPLIRFGLLVMLINFAGLLLVVIGVIPAAMVTVLSTTFIYREFIEGSTQPAAA